MVGPCVRYLSRPWPEGKRRMRVPCCHVQYCFSFSTTERRIPFMYCDQPGLVFSASERVGIHADVGTRATCPGTLMRSELATQVGRFFAAAVKKLAVDTRTVDCPRQAAPRPVSSMAYNYIIAG
eukprot:141729-Lingulodinium_polyedra.AAC.1